MTDGFRAGGLDRVASLVSGGAHGLAGMAGHAPSVPDAGASSAAVAGVLHAVSGVAGSVVTTADTAGRYVLAGDDAYRSADSEWSKTFETGGAR
jgi:hypothetical protein